ncbi:hypothetical protein BGZ63DRAFT_392869 [Mariannaea sp. PMI_226]|nr:hypothetical protein BGZ63DRAFT_392869 [Mariannaea sp. PMI_226]
MKIRARKVCHTCRARKLGCDGKLPACSQCLTRGYKCAGYQHDLIFRPPEVASTYKRKARRQAKEKSNVVSLQKPVKPASNKHAPEQYPDTRAGQPGGSITLTRSLSWTLLDMISLLVQNFSPVGYPATSSSLSDSSPPRICGAWIETLPKLAAKGEYEPILSSAVKAFATSILAQGCEGMAPICDAQRAYGLGLNSLRQGLQGQSAVSDVLIASIMCLFLSELIMPFSDRSSDIHAKGIQNLMELNTPEYYATGESHKLFAGFRPVLIVQALFSREPNFVDQDKWNTLPFSQVPMNSLQVLMTKATPLPQILRKIDTAKSIPMPGSTELAREALSELTQMLALLSEWGQSSEFAAHGYSWEESSSPPESIISLWFPSITAANCFTHFWSFWILCTENIRQLKMDFPDLLTDLDNTVAKQILDKILIDDRTIQICGWLLGGTEFLLREEFKLYGVASTVLPVTVAYETLRRYGDSGEKMIAEYSRVFGKINGKGFRFPTLYEGRPVTTDLYEIEEKKEKLVT